MKSKWLAKFPAWNPDARATSKADVEPWVIAWARLRQAWALPTQQGGQGLGQSMAELQVAIELADFFEDSGHQNGTQAIYLSPDGGEWPLSEAAKQMLERQWNVMRPLLALSEVRDAVIVQEFLDGQHSDWGLHRVEATDG